MPETVTRPRRGLPLPATALSLIHTAQVATRAELTAALGVSRATAGALLAELQDLGLIEVDDAPAGAGALGPGALGRPSHRITIGPRAPVAVAAQIHPDGYQAALVGLGGVITAETSGALDDPDDPERTMATVTSAASALLGRSGRRCAGMGVAVPSAVVQPGGLALSPLYVAWPAGTPLRDILAGQAARAGITGRVDVGNDINLAALAEHRHGGGRGATHLLVVASGHRGTGGAFVLGGSVYGGSSGLAMEAGHVTVSPGGRPCRCGNSGCLDVETDPLNFLADTGRRPRPGRPALEAAIEVLRAGYASDPAVRAAAESFTEYLGTGLAGLINVLNPDRVLLGGLHRCLLEVAPRELRDAVARRSPWGRASSVPLLACELDEGGLIGAGELAWQPVLDDPAAVLDA